jgi:hypothetical protein
VGEKRNNRGKKEITGGKEMTGGKRNNRGGKEITGGGK